MSVRMMTLVYAAHFHDVTFVHHGKKKETGEKYEKTIKVLNCNLKSVCLALADHANDEGEGSYPSVDTLSEKTELSSVTVIACLKAMKQESIITYEGRSKWNTGNYTVNKSMLIEMATWERQKRQKEETKAALVSESKAASISKVKPLKRNGKAALVKPSSAHKPSFKTNDDEEAEIQARMEPLTSLYKDNFGYITPLVKGLLRNVAITYPPDWYEPAFQIMLKNADHKSLTYVETVLKNWQEHGFGWKPGSDGKSRPQRKQTAAQSGNHHKYVEGQYADLIEH
jgi:hypothetical protein